MKCLLITAALAFLAQSHHAVTAFCPGHNNHAVRSIATSSSSSALANYVMGQEIGFSSGSASGRVRSTNHGGGNNYDGRSTNTVIQPVQTTIPSTPPTATTPAPAQITTTTQNNDLEQLQNTLHQKSQQILSLESQLMSQEVQIQKLQSQLDVSLWEQSQLNMEIQNLNNNINNQQQQQPRLDVDRIAGGVVQSLEQKLAEVVAEKVMLEREVQRFRSG